LEEPTIPLKEEISKPTEETSTIDAEAHLKMWMNLTKSAEVMTKKIITWETLGTGTRVVVEDDLWEKLCNVDNFNKYYDE
jgi:hypothetical protein